MVAVYENDPETERMQRPASRITSAWSYHEGLSSARGLAVDGTPQSAGLSGKGRRSPETGPSPAPKTIHGFKSCKIHETYNNHD